jgi:hypothetical protein
MNKKRIRNRLLLQIISIVINNCIFQESKFRHNASIMVGSCKKVILYREKF